MTIYESLDSTRLTERTQQEIDRDLVKAEESLRVIDSNRELVERGLKDEQNRLRDAENTLRAAEESFENAEDEVEDLGRRSRNAERLRDQWRIKIERDLLPALENEERIVADTEESLKTRFPAAENRVRDQLERVRRERATE